MNGFARFWGHLSTITHHRHLVIAHAYKAGILLQALGHDLSKYSPTEFIPGVRYYSGHKSPTEGERRTLGYSAAWMHHKGRNRHHWEYWTDLSEKTHRYVSMPMPPRYLAEMICDRMAAGKTYLGKRYHDGAPLAYLRSGPMKDAMHPSTGEMLERFLIQLRDEGEDAMFAALRRYVHDGKGETT